MRIVILGAGNLLLSDEGFGVHFIRHLEEKYQVAPDVDLVDAGTLGLMVMDRVEGADRLYIVDAVEGPGSPGTLQRFSKEQLLRNQLPIKLSPHQAGVQEMLLVTQLRGRCPAEICLWGIVPISLAPGTKLSREIEPQLSFLAETLSAELATVGIFCLPRDAV